MGAKIVSLLADAMLWSFCVAMVGFISAAFAIDDPAFALASGALWVAIRARSKAEVNTAHKNSEGN